MQGVSYAFQSMTPPGDARGWAQEVLRGFKLPRNMQNTQGTRGMPTKVLHVRRLATY